MTQESCKKERIKVLVTAFACSPDHGSEPGIGWGWVRALSEFCELTVITPSCNQQGVEAFQSAKNSISARFIYEDVLSISPRLNRKAKSKIGVLIRLFLWQYRLRKRLRILLSGNDYQVVHHLTLGSFRMPFSVTRHGVPSVVGPVGGCELFPPHLLPEGEFKIQVRELFRNTITSVHENFGVGMARYKDADLTFSCTRDMQQVFAKWGVISPVFPNIGMHQEQVDSTSKINRDVSADGLLRLLFVGNFLYWKGLELAVLALESLPDNVTLCCVGSGADQSAFEALIKQKNLEHRIELMGSIPRNEVLEKYAAYDVFLFPSLHDSGGMVVIEAMKAGLPVICLNTGGPAISVTPSCGRVVPMGSKSEIVAGLRGAVMHYLKKPSDIALHGEQAVQRVEEEYSWQKNAKRMLVYYMSIVQNSDSKN